MWTPKLVTFERRKSTSGGRYIYNYIHFEKTIYIEDNNSMKKAAQQVNGGAVQRCGAK